MPAQTPCSQSRSLAAWVAAPKLPVGAGRARVLALLETVEPLLRKAATHEIDTSAPLADVVEPILRLVEAA